MLTFLTEKQLTDSSIVRVKIIKISSCRWWRFLTATSAIWCDVLIPISDTDIRLVDGEVPHEGRVEILYPFLWTAVCNSLDSITADIACRQLGFPNATDSFQGGAYEADVMEFVLVVETVFCKKETSTKLQYCFRRPKRLQTSCSAATRAWLQCQPGNLKRERERKKC